MIFVHKLNDVYLQVECEPHVSRELSSFFEFEVPGARFMPAYRNRMWDGKIRLFSQKTNKIYVGLLSYLEDFFKNNQLEYVLQIAYYGFLDMIFPMFQLNDLVVFV